jgi:acyl dehydratase
MRTFARLDDLAILAGQEIGRSDWVVITQSNIDLFAQATDDAQWIHVDPVRAAAGPFGTTVAHGFLTLSMLSRLFAAAVAFGDVRMSLNYGLNRVRFPSPVPVGSRLRALCVLDAFEAIDGGAQLTVTITVEREGGAKPACVAEWVTRHFV